VKSENKNPEKKPSQKGYGYGHGNLPSKKFIFLMILRETYPKY
jgi:hypothetical protein